MSGGVLSCDTSVALGAATFDGSTIFAKNSDRQANECQPLAHVPNRRHAPGSVVRCQYVEIPQVGQTWEVIGSRPYWLWGFEMGVNEWGVAVGNEAVLSREPYEEPAALIGMDLVRLGLERGRTASEAVTAIVELTERHGQGGSCEAPGRSFRTYHNSYIVADPGEAWIVETAGRRWATQRVQDRAAISNLYTIRKGWHALSPGAAEHAVERGWGDTAEGRRLDFAAAYQDPDADLRPRACRLERARAVLTTYRAPIRVEDMAALLRDHATYGGDLPRGPVELPSICMHARPGATGETAAAMVAHLRPAPARELTATVWTAFGSPCLSVFRPVYPFAVGLPAVLDEGGARYDAASPWWAFERLQRLIASAPALFAPARARLDALEARFGIDAAEAEERAERLLARGDEDGARKALRALVERTTGEAVDLARRLFEELRPEAARCPEPAMVEAWRPLNEEVGLTELLRPALVGAG